MTEAPTPARTGRAGLIGGIVAGVVMLALLATGVVLFAGSGDDAPQAVPTVPPGAAGSGVPTGTLVTAWQAPTPGGSDPHDVLLGSWLLPGVVVRGSVSGLRAYDLTSGHPLWTLRMPAGATGLCAMAPAPNRLGTAAVAFSRGEDDCALVAAVDAGSGRLRWTRTLRGPAGGQVGGTGVSVSDRTVVVSNVQASGGLRISDGRRVWALHDRARGCQTHLHGSGGSTVLVDDFCDRAASRAQLRAVDADTGRTRWRWTIPGQYPNVSRVLSTGPVTVEVAQTPESEYLLGFDAHGRPGARIPLSGGTLGQLRLSGVQEAGWDSFVHGGTLVATAEQGRSTSVVAYDLVSGRRRWSWAGGKGGGAPVGFSGDGRVQALAYGTYSERSQLVLLDPRTGRATPVAALPREAGSFTLKYNRVQLGGGAVVVAAQGSTQAPVTVYTAPR